MKKLFATFALMGITALASAQTISFNETTHDYGVVSPKSDGNTFFLVKNTGDKPLVISRVQPSCGCTTPDFSKEPILPGKTGKINVHYAVDTHPGTFLKSIEVYSNDPQNSRSIIYIKGNVDATAPALTTAEVKKMEEQRATAEKASAKDAKKAVRKTKLKR